MEGLHNQCPSQLPRLTTQWSRRPTARARCPFLATLPGRRRSPGAFGLASIVRVASGPCSPRPGALPHLHVLTLYISLDNIPAIGTRFVRHGITFVRDNNKASTNLRKHGMPFEQAAQAFFDPFL